jgi:purine-cytosine permease-like protein
VISARFVLNAMATPPICGIYIADYLVNRRNGYDETRLELDSAIKPMTFVAWGVASFVGYFLLSSFGTSNKGAQAG